MKRYDLLGRESKFSFLPIGFFPPTMPEVHAWNAAQKALGKGRMELAFPSASLDSNGTNSKLRVFLFCL